MAKVRQKIIQTFFFVLKKKKKKTWQIKFLDKHPLVLIRNVWDFTQMEKLDKTNFLNAQKLQEKFFMWEHHTYNI